MPLCKFCRQWHGASFPKSSGSPVLLSLLDFSEWHLVQVLVDACHLSSARRLVPHAMMFLVPLLTFHGTSIYSCVTLRLNNFLWLQGLLIEPQVDRVSKECEGFIKIYSLRKRHSFGDNQSEFATQYGLNTKAPNTAQNFLRTKHKHNVLISGREKLYSDKFCFIDPLCEIFDGGSVWNVSHHRR